MEKICAYVYKNHNNCNNKCMGDSNFCHIKSHHNSEGEYLKHLNIILKEFREKSLPLDSFNIIDVIQDGACAYRSMALALLDKFSNLKNIMTQYSDITNIVKNIFESDDIDQNKITEIAKVLQQIIREWIVNNKNYIMREIGGITLEEFVLFTHNLSDIEEYDELYKIFAGDFDHIMVDTEKIYQTGKKKGCKVLKKMRIRDRWGGGPEFYAFSRIFNLRCNIFMLKSYDIKKYKIIKSSLKNPASRFTLYQSFGEDMVDGEVKFLLNDTRTPHYQYLMEKKNEN